MNTWQRMVRDFHEKFGCGVGERPEMRNGGLRADLIDEEADETFGAILRGDLPAAVDGLADLIYVCLGAAVAWGVDMEPIMNAVHRANMAKTGGGARSDGKVQKPEGWTPPDIEAELRRQGWGG